MEKDLILKLPTEAGSPTAHRVVRVVSQAPAADLVVVAADPAQAFPSRALVVVVAAPANPALVNPVPTPANPPVVVRNLAPVNLHLHNR